MQLLSSFPYSSFFAQQPHSALFLFQRFAIHPILHFLINSSLESLMNIQELLFGLVHYSAP